MSIASVVNDTVTSVSVVNALKPLPPTIAGYSVGGIDDTALDPAGGQTVQINGTGFLAGATITFDGNAVAVVTYVNATQLTFTSPAKSAGTYTIYVVNPDGGTAIYVPGIIYSTFPTWTTGAGTLGSYYETTSISNTVVASGDAPITYSLFSGSLPSGATLAANGVITGTAPVDSSSTTYSFTIEAIDAQLQGSTRSFSLTINTDVVTWVSPANATTYTSAVDSAIANVTLSATDAAGYAVTYSANALPTGLSLSGSNISGTPTVIADSSTLLTATAATTNRTATRTINWSITVANDPYFEYNTLLIPGASTTFVDDASTNNFAVTINGDTRPNSFNPYSPGYYSNFLDGTGDYLTVPANAAFGFGTEDFTIETWTYVTQTPTTAYVFDMRFGGGDLTALILNTTGTYTVYVNGETASATPATSILNRWVHWAIVRSSGTVRVYINGIQSTTFTASGSIITSGLALGARTNLVETLSGYLSNFRIVKGTAVYTSNFTPSTTPLTAIANTSLLTCQSNRFIDNSTNNFTITVNGNTTVNSFDPFIPNTSYSTYGSGYFDGTGDYLITPSDTAFTFGTGDFTIECWVYLTNSSATTQTIMGADLSVSTGSIQIWYNNVANKISFNVYGYPNFESTSTVSIGNWIHLAFTRSSGTFKMFINGTQSVSGSMTNNLPNNKFVIGRGFATIDAEYSYGYISDVRVVKGTAVYTTTFTPPSVPLTAISGTSLLTLQNNQPVNNSTFLDNSTNNFAITRVGNTTQGTFSPYGGNWSNYFDGTGDYLSVPSTTALQFGTGDFTVESWVYLTATPSAQYAQIIGRTEYGTNADWMLQITNANKLTFYMRASFVATSTAAIALNTWTHVAVSRSGSSIKLFINGVVDGTATNSGSTEDTGSGVYTIGADQAGDEALLTGYLSNLRVVKSTAVYTANFTPSTTPLTPITNTSLLTCADNRLVDDSINNLAITKNGDVSVQRYSPFNPSSLTPTSYSNYFDGTGDYLNTPSSSSLGFGTSDFTMEMWVYSGANGTGTRLGGNGTGGSWSSGNWILATGTPGNVNKFCLGVNNTGSDLLVSTSTFNNSQWMYVVITRSGNSWAMFVNGVRESTATSSVSLDNGGSKSIYLGQSNISGDSMWAGYISNFRVVIGTAVYSPSSTTITVPTAPLTAISGTQLLTCQSPTFIDNSTNNFTITAVGNSKPTIQNPFGYTSATTNGYTVSTIGGSAYFDGTGDYLSLTANSSLTITGGPAFTMEAYIYPLTNAVSQPFIAGQDDGGSSNQCFQWKYNTSNGTIQFTYWTSSSRASAVGAVTTNAIILNQWNHVAVSWTGTTLYLFINGVIGFSGAVSTIYGGQNNPTAIGTLGVPTTGNGYFKGYISDLRMIKGTALYTSNFVPPSAPLTPIQNTVLLNNMTSAGISDAAMMNNMETVGDAKLSTAVSKFGGSSMYFDGNDNLSIPLNTTLMNIGTGDFTIEGWVYHLDSNTYSGYYYGGTNGVVLRRTDANKLEISHDGVASIIVSTTSIPSNQWVFVTGTRSGSTVRIFINGVVAGTATYATSIVGTSAATIGSIVNIAGYYMNGYIDDLRITKGYARYTANFTPPTSAFPVY